jgi:hypothetical protein
MMTTTKDAARLFENRSRSPFIIANVKGADAEIQETGMVALRATLLDPENLTPSGMEIIVQMLPIDADKFANSVHEAAKKAAWKFPSDAKFVKWQEDHSGE